MRVKKSHTGAALRRTLDDDARPMQAVAQRGA